MLGEFLDKLIALGRSTAPRAQVVPELRKVLLVDNGVATLNDLPPMQRGGTLFTLGDVVNFAKGVCRKPECYVGGACVSILVDADDRSEVVRVPLQHTESFLRVLEMRKGAPMSPRDAVKFLRFGIETNAGVERLISALRRVDFTRTADGTNTTEHGRESYGKAIAAQVQNRDDIPEAVDITVSVFRGPDLAPITQHSVRIGVYLDLERQCVILQPLADEVDRAMDAAVDAIATALGEASIGPVFRGAPNSTKGS